MLVFFFLFKMLLFNLHSKQSFDQKYVKYSMFGAAQVLVTCDLYCKLVLTVHIINPVQNVLNSFEL